MLLAVTIVLLAAVGAAGTPAIAAEDRSSSTAWSSVFDLLRPVQLVDPHRVIVRFDAPSLAEWTAAGDRALDARQQRAFVARASRQQRRQLAAIRAAGVQFTVAYRYVRVFNGAALVVHGDSAQALHGVVGVRSVDSVRSIYPTAAFVDGVPQGGVLRRAARARHVRAGSGTPAPTARPAAAAAAAPPPGGAASAQTSVVVAVLDTGIDFNHPVLRDRQGGPGYDVLAGHEGVDGSTSDEHGTQVAGGVALGAGQQPVGIVPVRVLDAQPVVGGYEAVVGTSDALLAGLERAADFNGDGATADGADVVLVASGAPYAGFANSPEEQAIAGLEALGAVTVAAAGNDGASGDQVGTISSPAAARAAIAVGAADMREAAPGVDVHVRGGLLDSVLERQPLLTHAAGVPGGELPLVPVQGRAADAVDYLGSDVRSRVAGAVALVDRDAATLVADQVRAAADAGAVAVLVGGADAPATAGVIEAPGVTIPAIGIGAADSATLRSSAATTQLTVQLSLRSDAVNPAFGSVAGFTSRGPRHDGIGRPDVLAPGVGVLTTGAGLSDDGHERYVLASGSSIAAAQVAGAVAALRLDRPAWSPALVRASLLGSARPLGTVGSRPPVEAQGAGLADVAAAGGVVTVARPARLDFGVLAAGDRSRLALSFVGADSGSVRPMPQLQVELSGAAGPSLGLVAGGAVEATIGENTVQGVYGGWLIDGEHGLRVPWTVVVRDQAALEVPTTASIDRQQIRIPAQTGRFAAQLTVGVGGSSTGGSLGLRAAQVLEVHLIDAKARDLGRVAVLRGVLPGVYEFGVSGRDPSGFPLLPGSYTLRVRTISAATPKGPWTRGAEVALQVVR